jgi:hypothetical protein
MKRFYEALQVFQRSRIHDHIVRCRQALLARRLTPQNLLRLFFAGAVSRHETPNLILFRTVDDKHTVVDVRARLLHQQWYDVNLIRPANLLRASRKLVSNRGMGNGLKSCAHCRIAKYARSHPSTIEIAGAIQNVGAELLNERLQRRRARAHNLACNLICIEHRNAEVRKGISDGTFTARDAAGEGDEEWAGDWGLGAGGRHDTFRQADGLASSLSIQKRSNKWGPVF